jgi:prepilin-type N-terminal cleavage/methylation domain-containing protein
MRGGFTLVELLVVLAILALMVGMTMPLLGNSVPRAAVGAAAAEIRAALRGAGSQAIAEGRTVVFRGDPGAGYWVDRRHHALTTTRASGIPVRVAVAGAGRVSFFAWGGSSGGLVWVESPDGRHEIAVDAVTGHAVVRR